MSPKNFNAQEWGRRLDAGERNDPELLLAAQLEKRRPVYQRLSPQVKEELRQRLLAQAGFVPANRLGAWAVSLAALALLITAVTLFRPWQPPISPVAAPDESITLPLIENESPAVIVELPLADEEQFAHNGDEWRLLQLRQSVNSDTFDEIVVLATLSYTLSSLPQQATFALAPAAWLASDDGQLPENAPGLIILEAPSFTELEGELRLRGVVDPLAVWEEWNSFDVALVLFTEEDVPGLGVVVERMTFGERPFTLQAAWLDRVWLNAVSPQPGTTLDERASFTVEVGYRLLSAPTAQINLLLAHPSWESRGPGGRLPVIGVGEPASISRGEGVLTFAFTSEDATYLQPILGEEATLAVTMLTPEDDGSRTMRALTQQTFADYRWPVAGGERPFVGETLSESIPQVTVLPQQGVEPVFSRLNILDIQSSADSAAGTTPITFTVQVAYELAARHAEEADIVVWIAATGTGPREPFPLVVERVQAGAGVLEATFAFNPQRDQGDRITLRRSRQYELIFAIDRLDGTENPYQYVVHTSQNWEFGP